MIKLTKVRSGEEGGSSPGAVPVLVNPTSVRAVTPRNSLAGCRIEYLNGAVLLVAEEFSTVCNLFNSTD